MALIVHKIGSQEFLSIEGEPQLPKKKMRVDARPGVVGVAVWDQLEKGEPFSLLTVVDVEGIDEGRDKFDEYRKLIGTKLVAVIKDDVNYTGLDAVFVVLDIQIVQLKAAKTMVGGLTVVDGQDGALLRCHWDLVAVEQ